MNSSQKRQYCPLCLRPLKTCICKHVQPIENKVQLIILQHPLELYEVKNTGRLLHLCLKNSQIYTGEVFDENLFKTLSKSSAELTDIKVSTKNILLYPADNADVHVASGRAVTAIDEQETSMDTNELTAFRLWVLDATWRKSRKILHLNPWLNSMPRLSLDDCPPSIYKIRKAHSENQLSTLEASCYALQQLEQNLVDYAPIMKALSAFIAEQETFLPSR